MKNTVKRSAASRKAWRSRKRMKAARTHREQLIAAFVEGVRYPIDQRERDQVQTAMPAYMRRALPCPDFI